MPGHLSPPLVVVLDSNVLVSALWNSDKSSFKILAMVMRSELTPCFDSAILAEYHGLLDGLDPTPGDGRVRQLLQALQALGYLVEAEQGTAAFADEGDRKFYDVACCCNAMLITASPHRYPKQPFICTPAEYLAKC